MHTYDWTSLITLSKYLGNEPIPFEAWMIWHWRLQREGLIQLPPHQEGTTCAD